MTLVITAFTYNAKAQTDVTSTYITNADFSSQDGWTQVHSNDYWDLKNGFIGTCVVSNQNHPSTTDETHLNTEYCFGMQCRWQTNYATFTQTTQTLPVGTYVLSYDIQNTNGNTQNKTWENRFKVTVGSDTYNDSSTEWMGGASNWTSHSIQFTLTEASAVEISLGYGTGNNNVGNNNTPYLYVSHLKLTWSDPDEAARQAYETALEAAQAAIANTDYNIVTGDERTALQGAISQYGSVTSGYEEATTALISATTTFTDAKSHYDALATASSMEVPVLDKADSAKRTAVENAQNVTATNAADADEKLAAIQRALRAYYESHAMAEGVEGAVDFTDHITNPNAEDGNNGWTWTGNKNNPASNEPWIASTDDLSNPPTHKYFDGGNWSATGWTTTMKQDLSLPAGKYWLTAKGRAATNTTLTMAVGEASVELPHVGSTGNVFNRGWGDASVEFETNGESVTILVTATSSTIHEWFSISNFRLVQLEKTEIPMATEEDYAALAAAITTAENHVLGFEAGEYAPYNNIDAINALKAAKAIDPESEDGHSKEVVQNATSNLTDATWTANTAEVNGFYNGDWAESTPNTQSGVDVDVPGWSPVQGMRLIVGDVATDPGLASASAGKALFCWGGTTITYGEQTGYSLPLKANTGYVMTAKISGWRDGDLPSWVGLTVDNATVYVENTVSGTGKINVTEGNPFITVVFKFKTGEAGDYVVKPFVNKHFTITDMTLYKAPQATVNINIAADVKYATRIFPFVPELPNGVVAYSCNEVVNGTLTLDPVSAPQANVPYILEAESGCASTDLTDYDMSIKDIYTSGLLTGVYTDTNTPVGSYVLQKLNDKVAFYKVESENFNVPPYRAYLTAPAASGVKVLNFGPVEDTTGINAIEALTSGKAEIYNAAGVRVNKLEKGVNIIRTADGKTQKVLVK